MKKQTIKAISFLLLTFLILSLASCTTELPPTGETISPEETNGIETTEDNKEVETTEEARPTMKNPKVYYVEGRRYEIFYTDRGGRAYVTYPRVESKDTKAFEIELPADGDTKTFDEPLVIYESPEGEKIAFESITNSGGSITFQGVKSNIYGRIDIYSTDTCYIEASRNNKNTHKYTMIPLDPKHNSYEDTKKATQNKLIYKCNIRNEDYDESKCYVWLWDYDPIDFDYDPSEDTEMWEKWETD